MSDVPQISAIAPWFGSNRNLAAKVGEQLAGCAWVGVPFAGGMCELPRIKARSILVGDLHAHVLNLAKVVGVPRLNVELREMLTAIPFHEDALAEAQRRCVERERSQDSNWFGEQVYDGRFDVEWACDYFVCAWMSRSGVAGTRNEFTAGLSVRWDATGGDSATRFRHAADALEAWQEIMRRCVFVRTDCFAFLSNALDREEHAVYCDPPFPDAGDGYKFAFDEADQRKLAAALGTFKRCRIVVRYYDHPLIRELYPAGQGWRWLHLAGGKTQHGKDAPEVLIVKNTTETHTDEHRDGPQLPAEGQDTPRAPRRRKAGAVQRP